MKPSSSALTTVAERCPRALDHAEDGTPRDGAVFEAGTAGHAVLDNFHRASLKADRPLTAADADHIAGQTVARLTTQGRAYKGASEPPLDINRALTGSRMALAYLASQDYHLPLGATSERALAVDRDWRPVAWTSPDVHYSGIIDLMGMAEDEYGRMTFWVDDYKSAWTAGRHLLESVQLKGYALLGLAHARRIFGREPEALRLAITSIRTCTTWSETYDLAQLDEAVLAGWRAELDALIAAIPHRPAGGHRPAMPGPRCLGCVYRRACDAAPPETPETLAAQHAYHLAQARALEPYLREATAQDVVEHDGAVLGWAVKPRAKVREDAVDHLAKLYGSPDLYPGHRTLLQRVLTAGGVNKALMLIRGPDARDRRAALAAELLTVTATRSWGWHKPETAEDAAADPFNDEDDAG